MTQQSNKSNSIYLIFAWDSFDLRMWMFLQLVSFFGGIKLCWTNPSFEVVSTRLWFQHIFGTHVEMLSFLHLPGFANGSSYNPCFYHGNPRFPHFLGELLGKYNGITPIFLGINTFFWGGVQEVCWGDTLIGAQQKVFIWVKWGPCKWPKMNGVPWISLYL